MHFFLNGSTRAYCFFFFSSLNFSHQQRRVWSDGRRTKPESIKWPWQLFANTHTHSELVTATHLPWLIETSQLLPSDRFTKPWIWNQNNNHTGLNSERIVAVWILSGWFVLMPIGAVGIKKKSDKRQKYSHFIRRGVSLQKMTMTHQLNKTRAVKLVDYLFMNLKLRQPRQHSKGRY